MEIADESSNTGEVVCVEGSRDFRRFGLDGGDVVVFGSREKRHSLAPVVSLHPLSRMVLLLLE